jgi:DnaJ-domain-containing protein 1
MSQPDESVSAYPLHFPRTQPRTVVPQRSQFKLTLAESRDDLFNELRKLGARDIVLSSNVEVRRDGLPYANRPEPTDRGVAVYFSWRNIPYCLACDKWDKVKDNIRGIALHISALRGQERWGVGSVEQAFEGYKRLPPGQTQEDWWTVLEVKEWAGSFDIQSNYRRLAKVHHPDAGGDRTKFEQINRAYEQAKSQSRVS